MSKRKSTRGNTALKLDQVLEHVRQTRILVEVMASQNRVTAEATEVYRESLDARIEDLRRDLTQRIVVLELAVRQNSADIQKNSADIQKNSADIQKNSADIQKNSADIRTLQDELRELRGEVRGLVRRDELEALELRVSALERRVGPVT